MKMEFNFWIAIGIWIFPILVQGSSASGFPKSCSKIQSSFESASSSAQVLKNCLIYSHGNETKVEVLCDFETDGGGWTLFQKRSSGTKKEFSQNWNEYAKGLGSLDGNFWLRLDKIHALTKNGDQELRIELENFEGEKRWAKYSNFSISDALDFYRLSISGFYENSTAGDSMTKPNAGTLWILDGMGFSTKDEDNDKWTGGDCAKHRSDDGWWFNGCSASSLNGLYHKKGEDDNWGEGILWDSWNGNYKCYAKSEMKIRTRKS